jgi:hypothetical protein
LVRESGRVCLRAGALLNDLSRATKSVRPMPRV